MQMNLQRRVAGPVAVPVAPEPKVGEYASERNFPSGMNARVHEIHSPLVEHFTAEHGEHGTIGVPKMPRKGFNFWDFSQAVYACL